jgi:hypothetical protein
MNTTSSDLPSSLDRVLNQLPPPFWRDFGFWIGIAIGVGGLVFSIMAWMEAKNAKRAATAAGRTVKLQTIAIELTEIVQRLQKVQPGISFAEARDLIAETGSRVHRATSPFSKEPFLTEAIENAKEAVRAAQAALTSVRPTTLNAESEVPDSVYYGIESFCTQISNYVSDLIGLFEKQTFDYGDGDAISRA